MTDIFTRYATAVLLVSTDSVDVEREIVERFVLNFGVPNRLPMDQEGTFGGKLMQDLCRLLFINKIQTWPYKPKSNGETKMHNTKVAEDILKYCMENSRRWGALLLFSMVLGQMCQYPVDLFYIKPNDEILWKDGFAEWLDEQF
ncbi:uncharacterized protein LOC134841774 [Symsagittifera roscoffensis]|uniref:uncharacterized protein LOC134841774 n=1 Tax=Symsagittifera roscoffensis TaxID=84072 RepID=UPI00307B4215